MQPRDRLDLGKTPLDVEERKRKLSKLKDALAEYVGEDFTGQLEINLHKGGVRNIKVIFQAV